MHTAPDRTLCLFLAGDVMTGRAIDQILSHPGNPVLHERYVHDAREYVALTEAASGPIPRPVSDRYIWGQALDILQQARTDARLVNLETSITTNDHPWPGKEVLYRMHPHNVGCLKAAGIDICTLANNHMLDWGRGGLAETMHVLDQARIAHVGAGRDAAEAAAPAVVDVVDKGRVLVFAFASPTSGVPAAWRASDDCSGINFLETLSPASAEDIVRQVHAAKRPGDVAVVSIHWGPNWGHELPAEQIDFAHRLLDGGVNVVHGHSSHHVKALEVYRGGLILYGCGDCVTDYEGIQGHEWFRGDLAVLYLVRFDPREGRLVQVRLVPMKSHRFRLQRASAADTAWLADHLNHFERPFGLQVRTDADGSLTLVGQHLSD